MNQGGALLKSGHSKYIVSSANSLAALNLPEKFLFVIKPIGIHLYLSIE